MQSPAYKRHMQNIQNEIDAKKLHEQQKLNLFNEKTFYRAFIRDMLEAKKEVIIYSPFVTKFRSEFFKSTLEKLRIKNIAVFIITRPFEEQDRLMRAEVSCALKDYEELGVCICYLEGLIHQKVAIIDREILWEGSMNILSQRNSKEIMRRISDDFSAIQVMSYLGLNKKIAEGYKFQYERLYRNLVENSKYNFMVKIKTFLTEIVVPRLTRWPFAVSKAMIFILRGFKALIELINFIIRKNF